MAFQSVHYLLNAIKPAPRTNTKVLCCVFQAMSLLLTLLHTKLRACMMQCGVRLHSILVQVRLVSIVVKEIAVSAGVLWLDSWSGQIWQVSPKARHRCDVSSELFCPGANPRRWPRHSLHAWRNTASVTKI